MIAPGLPALLSVLHCPACHERRWEADTVRQTVRCAACDHAHVIENGVLHVNVGDEHAEVIQERESVPATEMHPELGGWTEAYTPATDPESSLAQAYLSLPYGNDSPHFQQAGYFQNVRRFAPEFDFILRHLPRAGRLLDLGADGTWSTAQLARHGLTCVALDITDHLSLAHLFQTKCPEYGLVNVDMHEPVFVDQAFDAVTAFNALHHSKRLDALAGNIARVLKPGGVLGFIEPYVQNAQQEADFGAPQSALGINENVHTIERWHRAFAAAGLELVVFSLTDSFNAMYCRPQVSGPRPQEKGLRPQASEGRGPDEVLDGFYASALHVTPTSADVAAGTVVTFQVMVESLGRAAWASRGPEPIRLSYHLLRLTPEGPAMVAFDNPRTLLTDFVCPGVPVTFNVPVMLAEPGTYNIEFDLVHETQCWFKDRGGQTARARVNVR